MPLIMRAQYRHGRPCIPEAHLGSSICIPSICSVFGQTRRGETRRGDCARERRDRKNFVKFRLEDCKLRTAATTVPRAVILQRVRSREEG